MPGRMLFSSVCGCKDNEEATQIEDLYELLQSCDITVQQRNKLTVLRWRETVSDIGHSKSDCSAG